MTYFPHEHSFSDKLIIKFDAYLRKLTQPEFTRGRDNPAKNITNMQALSESERLRSIALLRVNHAGEVCAQALYQGQALTAAEPRLQDQLEHAAQEEIDHLNWCRERLQELQGHASYLNSAWYVGSLLIGMVAGSCGDGWNLGFLMETEQQVVAHLDRHLQRLPKTDIKSQVILLQMREDEARHATAALHAGAKELPKPITWLMCLASKVMTTIAYRI